MAIPMTRTTIAVTVVLEGLDPDVEDDDATLPLLFSDYL